ncbi:DUF6152 family protein [Metapseudomonas resinovorans]|uniref:DUF5666 domain-containing protein n=1 Tax=Metapseudomonas resinovorans NBRC 106553 TaxID=1245471 RepID=S6BP92_METRE|nr:DUF6152 family protein [Pseudomonas resinovorans]BAN50854.1 hypothetical protein PCA10_51220 [Pseudomonas resinovorans NBRC 106553]
MRKLALLVACLALVLGATAAFAHHGWSSYDADKSLNFEAPIKTVSYRNPHAHITVDFEGREWHVVLAPISRMAARGLPESDLLPGKRITIVGYPRKDGEAEIRAERVIVDGRTVELR